uniref:CSON002389 protein n=1 Tax=Culicoides sonorensis TaxID=179676 RepID=A0A336LLV8_CULSO
MSENKQRVVWRCASQAGTGKKKCPARVQQFNKKEGPVFIISSVEHIHAVLKRGPYKVTKQIEDPKYEMVMSQKGKNQLKFKGYYYVEEKKTSSKTYWRCRQYTSTIKCPARLHQDEKIWIKSVHNHEPNDARREPMVRESIIQHTHGIEEVKKEAMEFQNVWSFDDIEAVSSDQSFS